MTTTTARPQRRPRSDGIRSRRAILLAAARLASTRGLDSLSIAELAGHVGMSKSGLFAHFGSKEELQLATIETANEIYESEVLEPALHAAAGIHRLVALADAFIDHLDRRVFPGGCFFAAAIGGLGDREGPVRERIVAFQTGWAALLTEQVRRAREAGDLAPDEDVEQLVFEVESYLLNAHTTFMLLGDRQVLENAKRAVRRRLAVA
jgi:AcrR family transcriptional regulator